MNNKFLELDQLDMAIAMKESALPGKEFLHQSLPSQSIKKMTELENEIKNNRYKVT